MKDRLLHTPASPHISRRELFRRLFFMGSAALLGGLIGYGAAFPEETSRETGKLIDCGLAIDARLQQPLSFIETAPMHFAPISPAIYREAVYTPAVFKPEKNGGNPTIGFALPQEAAGATSLRHITAENGFYYGSFGGIGQISDETCAAFFQANPHTNAPSTIALGSNDFLYLFEPKSRTWEHVLYDTRLAQAVRIKNGMQLLLSVPKPDITENLLYPLTWHQAGVCTMRRLGFLPPSVFTPFSGSPFTTQKTYEQETFAKTQEDFSNKKSRYFLTKQGVILDIAHTRGFARHTLNLYIQLLRIVNDRPLHEAQAHLHIGNDPTTIDYAVNPQLLADKSLHGMLLGIVLDGALRSEAISQLGILTLPANGQKTPGGLTPEDVVTNSIAGVTATRMLIESHPQHIRDFMENPSRFSRIVLDEVAARYGIADPRDIEAHLDMSCFPKNFNHFSGMQVVKAGSFIPPELPVKPITKSSYWRCAHTPILESFLPAVAERLL